MSLDLAAVAREAAARWRQDRAILAPLSGLLVFVPHWAMLLLVPDPPRVPAQADPAAVQAWAEAVQMWLAGYGVLYLAGFLVLQLGQLAIVALYVGRDRPAVGEALWLALRRLPRFVLAGLLVAMPLGAVGLIAASAPVLLVVALPLVVYVLGRTLLAGAAIVGRPGTGAARAVVLAWRWSKGAGLPLALLVGGTLVTMSVAIQAAEAAVEALRHNGVGSDAATAALDAGAAAVAWFVTTGLAMMQAVLFRRLAR